MKWVAPVDKVREAEGLKEVMMGIAGRVGFCPWECCGVSVLQASELMVPQKERSFYCIWELGRNIGGIDGGVGECFDHGWRCQKYRLVLRMRGEESHSRIHHYWLRILLMFL